MEDAKESSLSPFSSPFSPRYLPNLDPLSIDHEIWLMAEQRAQEILHVVQPSILCDKRRKAIIKYIKSLINGYFGTQHVFAFGSVPLKTYLPDGDVDLIAFCYPNMVEDFARHVCALLKAARNSEFHIPYVEFIDAQVKIVKCTVENISVDISFNQISGICTLCFLEEADVLIGKDHLFKRSVLLIKSWFYYESRILGAHHGLISTYALETMVLYLISLCHESVRGPLEVLYRFLEYYSKFDWENYCVTIYGPAKITSLVDKTATTRQDDANRIFLSKDFLNCRDTLSVRIKSYEGEIPEFLVKHLNVLDPLKRNNNLGRSVSQGSFHRITAAMSYGIRKLQEILVLPGEILGEQLENFYQLSLERNGQGLRPDLHVPVAAFGTGKCEPFDLIADSESYIGGLQFTQMFHSYTYVWDEKTLSWTLKGKNGTPLIGTEVFFPTATFIYHNVPLLPGANFNAYLGQKSRGTGTFIPEVTQISYKNTYRRVKKKFPEHTRPGLWQRSGQTQRNNDRVDRVENSRAKPKEERETFLDLSLEAFPPLIQSATKAVVPSEIAGISAQFKAFQVSPSPLVPSPQTATEPTIKPALSPLVSTSATSATSAMVVEKKQHLLENVTAAMVVEKKRQLLENVKESEKAPVQIYELENDMDFPRLG